MGAGVFIWAKDQDTGIPRPLECNDQGALKVDIGVVGVWELIETKTLTEDAATVDFEGISTDYNILRLTIYVRSTHTADDQLVARFNDDNGTHYHWQLLRGSGDVAYATSGAGYTSAYLALISHVRFSIVSIYVHNKPDSDQKIGFTYAGTGVDWLGGYSFDWVYMAARITKITLYCLLANLAAGSKFILEGTKE